MSRYWVSWISDKPDYRPLHDPPNKSILGWWCSGYDAEDRAILVAWVEAEHQAMAELAISEDWPETRTIQGWRFFNDVTLDWRPTDRFPLTAWMEKRVGRASRSSPKG